MRIKFDQAFAAGIRKKLIDLYTAEGAAENKRRVKDRLWHVSDLVFPRKAYYEIVQGRKITDTAIGFWFTGKAYGTEMQRVLGTKFAEVEAKWKKVVAHIDHFEKVLIEFKTSRKWTIPDKPSPHYTRQIGYYCAMTGTKKAKILVVYPVSGRTWNGDKSSTVDIAAWEVSFSDAELKEIRADMEFTIKAIEHAVAKKSPRSLPPVPKWIVSEFKKPEAGRYDEWADYKQPFNFIDIEVKYA